MLCKKKIETLILKGKNCLQMLSERIKQLNKRRWRRLDIINESI